MTPNLRAGTFKILSMLEGSHPLGVNLTRQALQTVYLNAPVNACTVKEAEGEGTYQLSIGGYPFTGEMDHKIIATILGEQGKEWRAIYQEVQDAYTIEPADSQGKGWTVPFDADPKTDTPITLQFIILAPSYPPKFSPAQLFRFEPIDDA